MLFKNFSENIIIPNEKIIEDFNIKLVELQFLEEFIIIYNKFLKIHSSKSGALK